MSGDDKDDLGVGRCDTPDCYRDAVMTYSFQSADEGLVDVDMCLPCRRVIELSRAVPWQDESEEWYETESLGEFQQVKYDW